MSKKQKIVNTQGLPGLDTNVGFKAIPKIETTEAKKGSYNKSAHLVDQMLKYDYPNDGQPDLFSVLKLEGTMEAIEAIKGGITERSEVVEGIKLSPAETKLIDCLCKLLHVNSETNNPKDKNFYSGNLGDIKTTLYPSIENSREISIVPRIAVTLYELTKEYKGGESRVSGRDIENVKDILTKLNDKHFLIRHTEQTKNSKGEYIYKEYESFAKLLTLGKATLEMKREKLGYYKKTKPVIGLNPIFRRQIDSKFIKCPNDLTQRTNIAYGSPNVSDITLRLRDYLMRELSSGRDKPEIGLERLYYTLAEKWMKESRKKKVKDYTEKALETMNRLGLLDSYEIEQMVNGEPKIVFHLNMDFK